MTTPRRLRRRPKARRTTRPLFTIHANPNVPLDRAYVVNHVALQQAMDEMAQRPIRVFDSESSERVFGFTAAAFRHMWGLR